MTLLCVFLAGFSLMLSIYAVIVSLRAVNLYNERNWLQGDIDEIRLTLEDVVDLPEGYVDAIGVARFAAKKIRDLQAAGGGTNGPSSV